MTSGKVLFNANVLLNGTDVSSLCREVHIQENMTDVDASGMNPNGVTSHLPGSYTATINLVAKSTFGVSGLDEVLRPLFLARAEFLAQINPGPLPTTLSNPQFQANVFLLTFAPIDAAYNALMVTPITLTVTDAMIAKVYT